MNEFHPNDNRERLALIDRLATGELGGRARAELFVWLDREPARWRRCALALLETRELEQALDGWIPAGSTLPNRITEQPHRAVAAGVTDLPPSRPAWRRRFALVAALLVAFGLGAAVQRARTPAEPTVAHHPQGPRSIETPTVPQPIPRDQARHDHDPAKKTPAPQPEDRPDSTPLAAASSPTEIGTPLPPYVRSQLEKQGYRVNARHGEVLVALPNGRSVKVPADQLQFRYVGQKSY